MYPKLVTFYESLFLPIDCYLNIGSPILKSNSRAKTFNDKFQKEPDCINIFTDGSKIEKDNQSFVGFAYWSGDDHFIESHKLPSVASIFSAECFALMFALSRIIGLNEDFSPYNLYSKYRIFSDSQGLVNALQNVKGLYSESSLIVKIRHYLFIQSNLNIAIKIYAIRAYLDIPGNSNTDKGAKEVALQGTLTSFGIPHSDLYILNKLAYKEDNKEVLIDKSKFAGFFYFANFFNDNKN